MKNYQIAIVAGSLRKDSFNVILGKAIAKMLPEGFEAKFIEIGDLPLYNQDEDGTPASSVARLRNEIKAADGVIFLTPEYNRSIPGVLKNALDHASRPWGQSVWTGKPAGVIGVALGAVGTAAAQQHLRTILAALNMPTMGHPEAYIQYSEELFESDGKVGARSKDFVQGWVNSYVNWVKTHVK